MTGLSGFSLVTRRIVKERAGVEGSFTRCEFCGVWCEAVQVHHRRPRKAGGDKRPETNGPANAGVVCAADHMFLEEHRAQAVGLGWIVRSWETPAEVPVRLWDGLFLLCDDGSRAPAVVEDDADVEHLRGITW